MKPKYVFLMCLFIVALFLASCAQNTLDDEKSDGSTYSNSDMIKEAEDLSDNVSIERFEQYTREELLEDYDIFKSKIENHHPKLYANEEQLARLYDSTTDRIIDGMTALEFTRILSPIVAELNCGHTGILLNDNAGTIERFPMEVKIFDNKIYMVDETFATEMPLGSEILSINDRTSSGVIKLMKSLMSSDGENESSKHEGINGYFSRTYLKYIEYSEAFLLNYRTPSGDEGTMSVAAMTGQEIAEKNKSIIETQEPFRSEFKDEYAVLTIRSFSPYGRYTIASYKAFIDEFFQEVKERSIKNVILDLRNNGGGDPMITSHLFSYTETESHPYFAELSPGYYPGLKDPIPLAENHFKGDLYILINGGCGSSTGHLLALLKYQNAGVFIGEESGASFACTDSSQRTILRNTQIVFIYSTELWQVAVEGLTPGRGIMPDFEVVPTIEDYLNEIDPVYDFAVKMIES